MKVAEEDKIYDKEWTKYGTLSDTKMNYNNELLKRKVYFKLTNEICGK
jgi:hypothetical protein